MFLYMSFGGCKDALLMGVYLGMEVLRPGVYARLALVCINGLRSRCSNLHTCQERM